MFFSSLDVNSVLLIVERTPQEVLFQSTYWPKAPAGLTGWEQEPVGSRSSSKSTNIFTDQSFIVVGYCLNLNWRVQVTNLSLIKTV